MQERADKLRKLKLVENIKDFDDFQQWALDNKGDWEMIDGGIRSLVDSLPLAEEPLYYVHCAEDLIDNAYDLTDFMATWNNVQQTGPQLRPVSAGGTSERPTHDGPGAAYPDHSGATEWDGRGTAGCAGLP
jgi:hypothetical protein